MCDKRKLTYYELFDKCSDLQSQITALEADKAELVELIKGITANSVNPANENPEYYTGLRAGLEDRQIFDKYDAVEHGWDQAFEYVDSVLTDIDKKIAALSTERRKIDTISYVGTEKQPDRRAALTKKDGE